MACAWFLPRAVVMKSAQPLFSTKIGARYAQAEGLLSAHSEKTMPLGGLPTVASNLSDPTHCQVAPFFMRMNISFSDVFARNSGGKALSIRRRMAAVAAQAGEKVFKGHIAFARHQQSHGIADRTATAMQAMQLDHALRPVR
jgi:hypothetical protein